MRRRVIALWSVPLLLSAAACAPEGDDSADAPAPSSSAEDCATDQLPLLKDGTLTIATDSPAFEPWFVDNDPTNGKGFESAVAYAVADRLGFARGEVNW